MTKQILPEPKITRVKRSPAPNTALSQNWIEANREKYRGRWVMLQGDRLLADANSAAELLQQIDVKGKFITAIY
jgi:hypothetical protein